MKDWSRLLCGITAGCAILVTPGCKKEEKKAFKERSIRVTLAKLQPMEFRNRIPVQGTVEAVEHAVISAKISGTVEELRVSEGDSRKKGDELFVIDRKILQNQVTVKKDEIDVKKAALKSAELSLQNAELSLKQAKLDYERAMTLRESRAISQASFESFETAFRKAETEVQTQKAAIINAAAQLKQAESNLKIAEKNLEDSRVRAPFDCEVHETFVEENEFVSTGQNILKLENPDKLEIVCNISAVYYSAIQVGKTRVEFVDNHGKKITGENVSVKENGRTGKKFVPCTVTYKSPGIDPASRTFKLKVLVPSSAYVVSGMLCELDIILEEKNAYGLPADSLLLRAKNKDGSDKYIVYECGKDNRAVEVNVSRGIVYNGYCEILNAEKDNLLNKKFVVTGQTFVNANGLLEEKK